jgi:hypothetical protein
VSRPVITTLKPFVGRRDQAIFRLLIDIGGRLGEIAEPGVAQPTEVGLS